MKVPLLPTIKKVYAHIYGPMPLREFSDYNEYWDKRITDGTPAVLHRFVDIAGKIAEGTSVVDIGCGDGAFLAYLKSVKPSCDVFGLDLSEKAIEALKAKGISGAAIQGRGSLRELVQRDFDNVVMMEVIEHVHDAEDLVAQALALNPKRLFITIPNTGYFIHRLRLFFGGRFPVTTIVYHVKEHIRFWTVTDFYQWADYMGCEVVSCIGQERTRSRFKLLMIRLCPSWFAAQLIFELRRKTPSKTT